MNKKLYMISILISSMLAFASPSYSQGINQVVKVPVSMNKQAIISHKASTAILLTATRAGGRIVAAGERGIIVTSDDNGMSWKQASVPTSINLTTLKFIDANNGWATGHMGVILHTKDGGNTWIKQLDGIKAAQIAVKSVENSQNERAIKDASYLVSDGPDKPFFDIDMQADGHGIAIGAFNLAFVTQDFGKTWQYLSPTLHNKKNKHLYQINKVKQGYVIFGEQGLILYSHDNGQNFNEVISPYTGSWFGMLVVKNGAWIAYGLKGNVYVSHNEGADWLKVQTNTAASISGATELSDGTLVIATQAGELLSAKAGGEQFSMIKQLHGFPITSIHEARSGDLVITGLRGVMVVNKKEIKSQ